MAKKEQLVSKKDFILELSKYTPQEINDLIISKGKVKKITAFEYVNVIKCSKSRDNNELVNYYRINNLINQVIWLKPKGEIYYGKSY